MSCGPEDSGTTLYCKKPPCSTDTGSATQDTGNTSDETDSGSVTQDTGSLSDDTNTSSATQDTDSTSDDTNTNTDTNTSSTTQDTDSTSIDTNTGGTDTGSTTGSQDTASETTEPGQNPIAPHGTTRGFLFTAKTSSSLAEKARLYFATYDGETITDLSGTVTLDIYTPDWAGDGDGIYFVQGYDVRTVAWPVPTPFAPVKLNVTGWSNDVSCRDNMLVYTSQPSDGGSVHIYTRSMDLDDERQITNYSGTLVINKPMMPTLSPSLDAVAYGLLNGDDVWDIYSSDLYIAQLGKSIPLVNLTQEAKVVQAKVVNRAPQWSPDGSLIAYLHVLDGVTEIRTIDPIAPTTSKKVITQIDNGFGGPDVLAWSPDSEVLAVIDGEHFGTIRIVDLDGVEEGRIDTHLFELKGISWR
jgi:hypothetical protein